MVSVETIGILFVYFVSLYFSIFLLLTFLDILFANRDEDSFTLPFDGDLPLVSILVPAYNEEKALFRTLKSIHELDYPHEKLDVIIIDDGSTDSTLTVAKEFVSTYGASSFMSIMSHKNMGKAASLNKALEVCKGEFFACLDADSFVSSATLKNMLRLYYAEGDSNVAIITPAMKVHSPQTFLQRIQWMEYLVMIFVSRLISSLNCLYVAPGPFSLYKSSVIRDLGGFDTHTVAEDQEIAYRVQKNQYRLIHCPTGFVHTIAPPKLYSFFRQRRRWYIGSMECAYKYRSIIGNFSYGDFGLIQMFMNLFGFLFGIIAVFLSFKFLILPLWRFMRDSLLVGFDFIPYLKTLSLSFNYTLVNMELLLPFVFLLLLALFFYIQAHKNSHERLFSQGYLSMVLYFFVYFILVGGILLVSACEFTFSSGGPLSFRKKSMRKFKW